MPEMKPVSSSNVAALGYDEAKKEAYVQFINGGIYVYKNVSKDDFEALQGAESIGSYLSKVFRVAHPCSKLG